MTSLTSSSSLTLSSSSRIWARVSVMSHCSKRALRTLKNTPSEIDFIDKSQPFGLVKGEGIADPKGYHKNNSVQATQPASRYATCAQIPCYRPCLVTL